MQKENSRYISKIYLCLDKELNTAIFVSEKKFSEIIKDIELYKDKSSIIEDIAKYLDYRQFMLNKWLSESETEKIKKKIHNLKYFELVEIDKIPDKMILDFIIESTIGDVNGISSI